MKSVVIFSLGYHGRAAFRVLRRHPDAWNILGFVDNSPQKQGGQFGGFGVYSPSSLCSIDFDFVVLAGRNIGEIRNQLVSELRIPQEKIMLMSRQELKPDPAALAKREQAVCGILQALLPVLSKNEIPHWICASGLLGLMRGQALAEMSDVDISVSQVDMAKAVDVIRQAALGYEISVTHHTSACRCWKKGDIHQIGIRSHCDISLEEPAIVDLHATSLDGRYGYMDANGIYLCIPGEHFRGFDLVEYSGMQLPVPRQVDVYLEHLYGPDWKKPAGQWAGHHRAAVISADILKAPAVSAD